MLSMRTYGCDVFCTEQNRIFVLLEGSVAPHQLMVKTMKRETPDTNLIILAQDFMVEHVCILIAYILVMKWLGLFSQKNSKRQRSASNKLRDVAQVEV